ncbi:ATP-grasp domain-containing protein [Frankia sp. Cj3]|uniref:ATP-grasp domain-containing protein n=1 Tax=Frankia sp. Cj3 TaxID=2880976 RepID=UPI001EF43D92|nr:ATP-grasp domain-containing protein [Frankia sp. Cj3]
MSRDTVLVFGGGGAKSHVADWSARLREEADRRELSVEVADEPANLVGLLGKPDPVAVWPVDYRNVAQACRLARERQAETKLRAVLGFREFSLFATAAAAAEVGLPWNSPASIARIRRKDRCRRHLAAHGFSQPELHLFDSADEAQRFIGGRGSPAIVKPVDSFGSQGVCLVRPGEDATAPVQHAFTHSPSILVEDFIDGLPCSAEGIIVNGEPMILALTVKSIIKPPYFATVSNSLPAPFTPAEAASIHEQVAAAVACVDLTHSLFHVEFFWTDGGIVLGEMHARPGGDWIHAMVAHHRPGLELFGLVLDDLLGMASGVPSVSDAAPAAASLAILSPSGVVTRVSGEEDARTMPDCLAVDVFVRPGDPVEPVRDSFQRAALVVASGCDVASAQALATVVAQKIQIQVG